MIFLAGLLQRSSLSFIFVTVIRVISILAILLTIAIEIYLIVINIRHVHLASLKTGDNPSTNQLMVSNSTSTSNDSTASFSRSKVLASRPLNSIPDSDSSYFPGTFVPRSAGGILFVTLEQVFNIIILILCFLSELSPPRIPDFFTYFFPPLGQSFGVGILGGLEVYVASILLSHKLDIGSRVAGWILFVIGALNILLGIIFGPRIRAKRSLLDAGTNYAKKVTHIDDLETGFKVAKKGKKAGKKFFKGLRTSQISRPKVADPMEFMEPSASRPIDISRPIIGYVHSSPTESDQAQIPTRPAPAYDANRKVDSAQRL